MRTALLLLLLLCLAACTSRPATPSNLTSASTPLVAADIFPDRTQHKHYAATRPEGSFIRRTLTPTPDQGSGSGLEVVSLTFDEGADPATDTPIESRYLSLARAADGSILLVSSAEGGRTTHFDPPLIFMPASLTPGQEFENATSARVVGENGREQTSGRATRRITYVGDAASLGDSAEAQAATGVAGTPSAFADQHLRVVSASLDMDLFPARVITTTTYWVGAEGILREQQTTRITVLGVPYQTRRHDVILTQGAAEPLP